MRKRFTDISVNNIKPPATGRADIWDTESPLGLRLSASGSRTYIANIRVGRGGGTRRLALGRVGEISLSDARQQARTWKDTAKTGRHPGMDRRRQQDEQHGNTFGKVVDDFMAQYVERMERRAATVDGYERALRGKDVDAWRNMPVVEIERRDVRAMIEAVYQRGPIASNRTLAYLRKFFGWCVEQDLISASPCTGLKPLAPEGQRERVLSPEEIPEVWRAIEAEGGLLAPFIKILLLTGQRRRETAAMQWEELHDLDGDNPRWEIPKERTKNKQRHLVPLAPQVVDILRECRKIKRGEFVFGETGETPISSFSRAKERIDLHLARSLEEGAAPRAGETLQPSGRSQPKKGDIKISAKGYKPFGPKDVRRIIGIRHGARWGYARVVAVLSHGQVEARVLVPFGAVDVSDVWLLGPDPWTLHDLRRTVSTRMHENLHILPHEVEAVLNHTSGHRAGVAGRYNWADYAEAKRRALTAWAIYVDELLGRQDRRNVVRIPAARGQLATVTEQPRGE